MPARAALESEVHIGHNNGVIAVGHLEADGNALIFLAIFPCFRRIESRVGVMQFAGHAVHESVKFLIVFYTVHQRTIVFADVVPIDAVKFGIVITIAHISPNVFQNGGAIFG